MGTESFLKGKRVVITGASGMMGRALARYLAAHNTVYGVSRFTQPTVRAGLEKRGVKCITCDLACGNLAALPEYADALFHFAVCWDCSSKNFQRAMDFNGFLIGRLLDRFPNLEHFVVGSTVAVYTAPGAARYNITEETPTLPAGGYGTTKLAGDIVATQVARRRRLRGAILRYWFPYSDETDVGANYYAGLVNRLRKGEPFMLPTDEEGCQQPLFISDLARITVDSLRFASADPFVLNVAGHEKLSLEQIVSTLGEVFGVKPKVQYDAIEKCNLLSGSFNLRKLSQTCGLGRISFREGLRQLKRAIESR